MYGHSANPIDQHQVLALKYDGRADGTGSLDVWDNNDANRSRTLTLDFRGAELVVTQMLGDSTADPEKPIKGIICEEYYSIQPPLSLKRT